ncbi:nuclear transport factor 2 family protein [Streptomyces sp. NBC_00433]
MSEQIKELVGKLYDGLAKADVEAIVALFDPSVEIETPPSLPWSKGSYSGIEGAVAYFTSALEYLEDTGFTVDEVRVDGEWAAAIGDWTGRFRASGGEFNVRFVHFWLFRDGKVVKGSGISDTVGIVRAYAPDSVPAAG